MDLSLLFQPAKQLLTSKLPLLEKAVGSGGGDKALSNLLVVIKWI